MKRRDFLSMSVGSLAFAGSRPLFARPQQTGPVGANDRISAALIGCGGRGRAVARGWQTHADSVFVAACDVDQGRTTSAAETLMEAQGGAQVDTYEDYREILDRQDVDAVLIGTPDHWHAQMCIDAMAAGKDVYVEKPVSNKVEDAIRMRDAARESDRIVQVGTQQRSWGVFQEAAQLFMDGYIGSVSHAVMMPPSGRGRPGGGPIEGTLAADMPAEPIPDGFNWELFQGPAPRRPYLSARRGWRRWYDYGGGTITDWGVHLIDVMAWLMELDTITPRSTSASSLYSGVVADPAHPPNLYTITWEFDTFLATLTNAVRPGEEGGQAEENYGNWFYGELGVLQLNRFGYEVSPFGVAAGRGRGGRGGQPDEPAIEHRRVWDPNGRSEAPGTEFDLATINHVRNFLDSMRSRQQPVSPMEAGVAASMPALLGLVAIQEDRTVHFDGNTIS